MMSPQTRYRAALAGVVLYVAFGWAVLVLWANLG